MIPQDYDRSFDHCFPHGADESDGCQFRGLALADNMSKDGIVGHTYKYTVEAFNPILKQAEGFHKVSVRFHDCPKY
jgi:hypothetical protein